MEIMYFSFPFVPQTEQNRTRNLVEFHYSSQIQKIHRELATNNADEMWLIEWILFECSEKNVNTKLSFFEFFRVKNVSVDGSDDSSRNVI